MDRPEYHSTDRLEERGVEKGAADIPPSKVGNGLCSTRQILALFRGQPWGEGGGGRATERRGRSAYGPFSAPSRAETENENCRS